MKLNLTICNFHFHKHNDAGGFECAIDVMYIPLAIGGWKVIIYRNNIVVDSFQTALTPNDHNAHNLAWEHLQKNP